MDILVTVLAFLSVMVVLSTIVTVAVETIHKVFRFRRAGLEEMLRALYVKALSPRLSAAGLPSPAPEEIEKAAKKFAAEVTANHAFSGQGRFWWLRNIPILNGIFHSGFERLSTLQFAEQLARTGPGQQMAADLGPERQRSVLAAAAYEFDRFGEAQGDYFRRRAKALSVMAGIVVAVAFNVDAVTLFKGLASNPRAQLVAIAELEQARATPEGMAALAGGDGPSSADLQALARHAASLSAAGLPIGASTFPYCVPAAPGADVTDVRCQGEGVKAEAMPARLFQADDPGESLFRNDDWGRLWANLARAPADTGMWALSLLVTGGLLGLGAPFWFNAFRRLAAMAGPAAVRAAAAQAQTAAAAAPAAPARDAGAADIDALHRAFVISAGGDVAGDASIARGEAVWQGAAGPGASLGGGSADPAFVARVLRE